GLRRPCGGAVCGATPRKAGDDGRSPTHHHRAGRRAVMSPREPKQQSETGFTATAPAGLPSTGAPRGAARGKAIDDRFGATDRTDNWWLIPTLQAIGLVLLIGHANYPAHLGGR